MVSASCQTLSWLPYDKIPYRTSTSTSSPVDYSVSPALDHYALQRVTSKIEHHCVVMALRLSMEKATFPLLYHADSIRLRHK